MTTQEAIETLKRAADSAKYAAKIGQSTYLAELYAKNAEVLEMAILALETRQELSEAWAEDHCAECRFRRGE